MKDAVVSSTSISTWAVTMRAKPKSASTAMGGVESEIRMFD